MSHVGMTPAKISAITGETHASQCWHSGAASLHGGGRGVFGCLALTAWLATGCGNAVYAYQSSNAHEKLEQARELNAEKLAPYEFYMAAEFLHKADSEAAEADYGDAIDFATTSEQHADKAIALSRDAHRGAGR